MKSEYERFRKIRIVLWWVLLGNVLVAFAKIVYGHVSGSVSIKADGLHSLADSSSNIVGLLALAKATDAPDAEHPYGHRKMEVVGALIIAFMICLGLMEIGRSLLAADYKNHLITVGAGGYGVIFFTLLVNSVVTWQERRYGTLLKSPILIADAQHTLSDSFATLGVLAAFILSRFGLPQADLAVGVFILILVGRAAYTIFFQGIDVLSDRSILDTAVVESIVRGVPGVIDCHQVRSRGMAGAVFLDFHILVGSQITVEEAHRITHEAETAVRAKFPDIVDVVIHTEPESSGREPYAWE